MSKFFDFEEALNCLNNEIPVSRKGNDGKIRSYYKDENGDFHCKVGKYDYILPFNELLKAENWTYETND